MGLGFGFLGSAESSFQLPKLVDFASFHVCMLKKNPFAVVFMGFLEDTELDACVQSSLFIQQSALHPSK